jgi:hypothetical protein
VEATVVPSDDSRPVQWWWWEKDRHLVYHESGNLTFVDTETFRKLEHPER